VAEADCVSCGSSYYVRPSKRERSRFCSRECKDEFYTSSVESVCEYCGEAYEVKSSRASETRFCSRECRDTHKRKQPQKAVTVNCTVCEASIRRIPYEAENNSRYYCSTECQSQWMQNNWQGEDHPNYRGGPNHGFGKNWLPNRQKVRERDEVCQVCGEDGTNTFLDVHHIVPRRAFDNVTRSNNHENLVLLCRPCHNKAERGVIPCPHPHLGTPSVALRIRSYIKSLRCTVLGV